MVTSTPKLSSRHSRGRSAARGFSMLELIVVMSLLAVISAALVPVYGASLRGVQLRDAQNNFVALVKFTQEKAVRESLEYRLYLDEDERRYWVEVHDRTEDNEKIFAPVEASWGRARVLPAYLEFRDIDARKDRDRDAEYIACFPNGACDRAEVSFEDTRARDKAFTVETLGALGRVSVDKGGGPRIVGL